MKMNDLTGMEFGRLKVLELSGKNNQGRLVWLCQCSCGNVKKISGHRLTQGTKSCGCLQKEIASRKLKTHGMSETMGRHNRLYRIWMHMRERCNDPKNNRFELYGGRGISVCEQWKSFESFYEWAIQNGYDEKLTLDRIDVNGSYSPENCRWVTYKQQSNNKRNNKNITVDGETHTIAEWAKISGIKYQTLYRRIVILKWDVKEAITIPLNGRR